MNTLTLSINPKPLSTCNEHQHLKHKHTHLKHKHSHLKHKHSQLKHKPQTPLTLSTSNQLNLHQCTQDKPQTKEPAMNNELKHNPSHLNTTQST